MSEDNKQLTDDTKNTVYVAQEDIDAITRFFKHFKWETSIEFKDAVTAFENNKTLETQKNLRFNIATECLRMKGHNELIDDLFKNVVTTSDKLSYDIQFEKDLEEVIGVTETEMSINKALKGVVDTGGDPTKQDQASKP